MPERTRSAFDEPLIEEFAALGRAGVTPDALALLRWKYLANPHGQAEAQILRDDDGELIGRLAYVRHRLQLGDRRLLAATVTDLLIVPEHQSLPTLIDLTRRLDQVDVELLLLLVDDPTEALFRTVLRSKPLSRLVDVATPVRALPLARKALGKPGWLALPADALLPLGAAGLRRVGWPRGVVLRQELPDAAAYDELIGRLPPSTTLTGVRDHDWHRWRFHERPHAGYAVRYAWRGSQLLGYLAVADTKIQGLPVLVLLDVVLPDLPPSARRALILDLWRWGRRRGDTLLFASAGEGDVVTDALHGFPFREVPARFGAPNVRIYHRRTPTTPDWLPAEPTAALTMADFDIY